MRASLRAVWLTALALIGALCAAGVEVGEEAPPFVNPDLQNKYVMSKDLLGRGWVILEFFATDCEGCQKELPVLERLQAEYREAGLRVVVFATDLEGAKVVEPYFRAKPTPLRVLLDRYRVSTKKYGVSEIPSLFLVNPNGSIAFAATGFREDLYDALKRLLDAGR